MADHEHIIFYEISKGPDSFAYISDYACKPIGSTREGLDILDACVKADQLPPEANLRQKPYPPDGDLRWSTVAQNGKNLYVLRIDENMNAHFNSDPAMPEPVICFCPHLPATLEPVEKAERHSANERWAVFTVDTNKILCGIEQFNDKLEHEHTCAHHVGLPLYLNLIDDETGLPALLAANHYHGVAHSNAKNAAVTFAHRGPHFTSCVSMMYVSCPE